ncbi:MAG: hypothetical protein FWD31_02135 [Planctomycetaceae bacterium]|nr:hypothetical protein [Planctomycetaceae bacterium]
MKITWSQFFSVFGFAWRYRVPICATIEDVAKLESLYQRLTTESSIPEVQQVVKDLLNLRSVQEIVSTTPTKVDDVAIEKLQQLVDDDEIFMIAWKIFHGDWSIKVAPTRLQAFLQRIRKVLPWATPDTKLMELALQELKDERAEIGVVEIVSLMMLLHQVLPKIIAIFKK